MCSFPIVIHFQILKDILFCLFPCLKPIPINHLYFKRMHETFSDSVIPAVTLATHTRDNLMLCKQSMVITTGILATPVRMMDQPSWWIFTYRIPPLLALCPIICYATL